MATLNVHHDNKALIFQFILSEFLQSGKILKEKPHPEALIKLIGDPHSPFYFQKGSFNKIRYYSSKLSSHTPQNFMKTVDLAIKKAKALTPHKRIFKEEFLEIERIMKKAFGLILESLSTFEVDENILYFLLRRNSEFTTLYGSKSMTKLYKLLCPQGMKHTSTWMIENFNKRGFDYLLPIIEERVEHIK